VLYGESSSQDGVLFQVEVLDAMKTQSLFEELASKYSVTHLFIDKKKRCPLPLDYNRWATMLQEESFAVLARKMKAED